MSKVKLADVGAVDPDLIDQHQRILRLGFLQALNDFPRHGAHVRPPGAADNTHTHTQHLNE